MKIKLSPSALDRILLFYMGTRDNAKETLPPSICDVSGLPDSRKTDRLFRSVCIPAGVTVPGSAPISPEEWSFTREILEWFGFNPDTLS